MNRLILLLLMTFAIGGLSAQDLIVLQKGDSINCDITKIKQDYIHFTFVKEGKPMNTLVSLSEVKDFHVDYYTKGKKVKEGLEVDYYEIEEPTASLREKVKAHSHVPNWRFAFQGGLSWRTAKTADGIPSEFDDYYKDLKSGLQFSADLAYYINESWGIGFKFSRYASSSSLDNVYMEDEDGNLHYTRLSEDIAISFLGPTLATRFLNDLNGNAFILNFSLGYMGYDNDMTLFGDFNLSGSTVGMAFDIGYDIMLSDNVALGFQASYYGGVLTKYEISDGTSIETIELEEGEYEGLQRLDLSAGLRFYP